jgi:hypothetical protein
MGNSNSNEGFAGKKKKHNKKNDEKYLSVRTPGPKYRHHGRRHHNRRYDSGPYRNNNYYGQNYGYDYPYGQINVIDPSLIYNPIPLPVLNQVPIINQGFSRNTIDPNYMYGLQTPQYYNNSMEFEGEYPYSGYLDSSCGGSECNYYKGGPKGFNKGFKNRCDCCQKGKKCRNDKLSPRGVKYQDCCDGLKCKTVFGSDMYGHCS